MEATTIVMVGIRVRPVDKHIWDPIAQSEARLVYCGGPSGAPEFERWFGETRPGRDHVTLAGYFRDEFVYRFDRRWREGELFGFVLHRAARHEPLPYRRLVAEAAG